MPLLLLAPRDDQDRSRLAAALARVRAQVPGTFLLVACEGPPPALAPAEDLDWVSLPGLVGTPEATAYCGWLARAYGADATLDLGTEDLSEAKLDGLVAGLPFEAFARPGLDGDGGQAVLARLRARLRHGAIPTSRLLWLGPMGTEVTEFAEKLMETGNAPLEVRFPTSTLQTPWRRPAAWLAFLRAVLRPSQGISFRLVSASQDVRVQAAVGALNRLLHLASRGAL
ncbi:MAG TPA: hypothetical protein PK668_05810 [Myxococcota bacterium]|nr:hypothetical protein [Myxococcota bacterium]HRY92644.1 hypothetical protein [Myxococcota bacterium]HSA22811.1 hypothetical protein [Myxococcota bacterium]